MNLPQRIYAGLPEQKIEDRCICEGNWRKIVGEYQHLFDRKYKNEDGKVFIFYGILHGSDDYYYLMWNTEEKNMWLLSCVGHIESYGYTLIEE